MNPILKFASQLGESALSIVGVRTVEEPHYIRRPLTDTVEIRQYGSRIAAETTVTGEKQKASTPASPASPATSSAAITATPRSR